MLSVRNRILVYTPLPKVRMDDNPKGCGTRSYGPASRSRRSHITRVVLGGPVLNGDSRHYPVSTLCLTTSVGLPVFNRVGNKEEIRSTVTGSKNEQVLLTPGDNQC